LKGKLELFSTVIGGNPQRFWLVTQTWFHTTWTAITRSLSKLQCDDGQSVSSING